MEENQQNMQTQNNVSSGKVKKPIYKKWWFWLIIVVVAIGVFGAAGGDEEKASTEVSGTDTSQAAVEATQAKENPNKLGNYECEVVSATLCKDFEGKPAVKIRYNFTNNNEEPASFDFALIDEVYQDGVQLETAILGMDDDVDYGLDVKIKKGVTKEVTKVYILRDETTPLDVEIGELISFNDDKIVTKVEIK